MVSEADPVTVGTYFLAPKKHSTTSHFPCEVPTEALPHQNLCDFWECWMSNSPYITKYFLITSCIPTLYWTNYSFPEEKNNSKKPSNSQNLMQTCPELIYPEKCIVHIYTDRKLPTASEKLHKTPVKNKPSV